MPVPAFSVATRKIARGREGMRDHRKRIQPNHGNASLFTKLSNTQAFVLSKHLQNQFLSFGQFYWVIYWVRLDM